MMMKIVSAMRGERRIIKALAQRMTAAQYFTLKHRFEKQTGTEKQTSIIALLTLLQHEKNPHTERTLQYMKYASPLQRMQLTDAICTYWDSTDGLLHPEIQAITHNVLIQKLKKKSGVNYWR